MNIAVEEIIRLNKLLNLTIPSFLTSKKKKKNNLDEIQSYWSHLNLKLKRIQIICKKIADYLKKLKIDVKKMNYLHILCYYHVTITPQGLNYVDNYDDFLNYLKHELHKLIESYKKQEYMKLMYIPINYHQNSITLYQMEHQVYREYKLIIKLYQEFHSSIQHTHKIGVDLQETLQIEFSHNNEDEIQHLQTERNNLEKKLESLISQQKKKNYK